MFDHIANGWELAKSSLQVLKLDKELLLFPLLSGIACLLVLGSFALPLWGSDYLRLMLEKQQVPQDVLAYVILFAFYFVNYFVIVFFNTALMACAIIRFRGGDPVLSDGLKAAGARLPQIAGWALVSATVGLLLRVIGSRSGKAGQLVTALIGGVWSVATYFVVPVLVIEKANPLTAVQRSLAVLRKTWGESLAANFGIGIFSFLCMLVALIPAGLGIFALANGQTALGVAGLACGISCMILISLVSSALNTIVIAALYLFATDGEVPQQFSSATLREAFESTR